MGLSPWEPVSDPGVASNMGPQLGALAPAPAPAREAVAGQDADRESGGEVVAFPGTGPTGAAGRDGSRAAGVVSVWFTDASDTGRAALDGSVWRARPPALRDLHARVARAEWAGDVPALRGAGQVFGYASLAATAVLYAVAWLVARPLRAAVAGGIVLPVLFLLLT